MATSPIAAMHAALAAYLTTYLQANGLPQAECRTRWPQPNDDLKLAPGRVVAAVVRAGAPRSSRIGGPTVNRVVPGVAPAATYRWDYDQLDQDLLLGVWADSDALRDDVDEVLFGALNRPYWTTCPPLASTTIATVQPVAGGAATATVPAPGRYVVTPASLADLWPGTMLEVEAGTPAAREVVRVEAVTPFGVLCTFTKAHAAAATLVEVAARNMQQELGLTLRCPLHFNTPARFDFDAPASLDEPNAGTDTPANGWQSVREGVGSIRHLREAAGTMRDKTTLTFQAAAQPATETSPTPRTIVVFGT